jgi:hypothetical protein
MDVDVDGFTALLAARLATIVPDGFHVELVEDMLWFRSDEGRFPGQRTMPEPRAQARGSLLHLWYGDADDAALACEPIPLAGPEGG